MLKLLLFLPLITSFQVMAANSMDTIVLSIGESHNLPATSQSPVRIQKRQLLSVKDLGSQIRVTAKKLGKTKVTVGKTTYLISILHKKKYDSFKQLKKWLQNKRGPQIEIINQNVVVSGKLLTLSDFKNLEVYIGNKGSFFFSSIMNQDLKSQIQIYISKKLAQNNLPSVHLQFEPHLQATISKEDYSLLSLYKATLNPFGIQVLQNQKSISQAPMIQVQLHILHAKKSFLQKWGVQWPNQVQASIVNAKNLSLNNLDFALQSLETSGEGRLLASPLLVTRSNKKARFHSGGEFPIQTIGQFSNSVQWKQYGIFLSILPKAGTQESLELEIKAELSAPDESQSTGDVPGLITNKLETLIYLKKPRPIVISGMVRKQWGQSQQGLAGLSRIPLLSSLFSTASKTDDQSELIFILTPSFL